jgi:hypothetical protein
MSQEGELGGFISTTGVCQNLGCGVVFRITPPGTYTVLHALDGTNEANYPLGVIQASDGNLYGTTGNFNPGTLFRVNPTATVSSAAFTLSRVACFL